MYWKRNVKFQFNMLKQSAQRLGSQATYLPLKVNSAGVIPVIFAMAFFLLPRTLTLFFPKADWAQNIAEYANPSNTYGMIVYVILIIAFAYFMLLFKLILKKWLIT